MKFEAGLGFPASISLRMWVQNSFPPAYVGGQLYLQLLSAQRGRSEVERSGIGWVGGVSTG